MMKIDDNLIRDSPEIFVERKRYISVLQWEKDAEDEGEEKLFACPDI